MIKAVIVEDEELAVLNLKELIKVNIPDIEVVEVCFSAKEALERLPHIEFDLLFLDIQFNDNFDAFEFLNSWQFHYFHLIFITSYDRYAIEAFKHNAIDYITKPIDEEHLKNAVKKVRSRVFQKQELEQLFRTVKALRNQQVVIKGVDSITFVNPNDIIYFRAEREYSSIFYLEKNTLTVKKLLSTKNIGTWEEDLDSDSFLRIHKSYMVNMDFIVTLKRKHVVMSNSIELDISRDRRKELGIKIIAYKSR